MGFAIHRIAIPHNPGHRPLHASAYALATVCKAKAVHDIKPSTSSGWAHLLGEIIISSSSMLSGTPLQNSCQLSEPWLACLSRKDPPLIILKLMIRLQKLQLSCLALE